MSVSVRVCRLDNNFPFSGNIKKVIYIYIYICVCVCVCVCVYVLLCVLPFSFLTIAEWKQIESFFLVEIEKITQEQQRRSILQLLVVDAFIEILFIEP